MKEKLYGATTRLVEEQRALAAMTDHAESAEQYAERLERDLRDERTEAELREFRRVSEEGRKWEEREARWLRRIDELERAHATWLRRIDEPHATIGMESQQQPAYTGEGEVSHARIHSAHDLSRAGGEPDRSVDDKRTPIASSDSGDAHLPTTGPSHTTSLRVDAPAFSPLNHAVHRLPQHRACWTSRARGGGQQ